LTSASCRPQREQESIDDRNGAKHHHARDPIRDRDASPRHIDEIGTRASATKHRTKARAARIRFVESFMPAP